jgi:ADP-ribosyl-[dinitrogen reductase] hydrolase
MAVGDALGAPVEFDGPEDIAPKRDWLWTLPGGGGFGWLPGEFTDDTQMALVLARHLLEGELDVEALAREFASWALHPETKDVGAQTHRVLRLIQAGQTVSEATSVLDPRAAGNGKPDAGGAGGPAAPLRHRAGG